MLNTRSMIEYEDGLRTLLDLCEQCYGPNGIPIFTTPLNNDHIKPTKNSKQILQTINSYSENPLVKMTINVALEQNKEHGDHTFYIVILALNLYLKLKRENTCFSKLMDKLKQIEDSIEKLMLDQNRFHKSFDNNFEFLVQLSANIIKPKLYGYSVAKLESFCRFVVSALLQSMADQSHLDSSSWVTPTVLSLPTVSEDPYKCGEIFEGILIPVNLMNKVRQYLQRVVELRSFVTYELIYIEKRKLNAILMIYDNESICETIYEQMEINVKHSLPSIKQTIIDSFESSFIGLLEKSNVGMIIVGNQMNGNLRSKLSDRSIFLIDSVDKDLIIRISRVFNVEIVKSIKIEDTEGFVFQTEIPNLRQYRSLSFLAISKPGIITLIFYKLLDSNSQINEELANLLFHHLSNLLFAMSHNPLTNLCHGAGCTEFIIAGTILRSGDHEKISSNFLTLKTSYNHTTTQAAVAESLIRIWQLTRDPVNDPKICKSLDELLTTCQNNFSCICGHMRQFMDTRSNNISDISSIKFAAIKKALRLVNVMMRSDLVILNKI